MGHHPGNGHHPGPDPRAYWPHHAPPSGGNGYNLAKGYLPVVVAIPAALALIFGAFQLGGVWQKQQSTIEKVQDDVAAVKRDVGDLKTSIGQVQTTLHKVLERKPAWTAEVREAHR
jgi:hypothetical protein